MKDDAIERALRGLAAAEAPSGLEGRVLRRLAESGSERTNEWLSGFRLAGGLVLAGVLVGILGHLQGGHTPGAKAPFPLGEERPKAEALGYLQANGTAMTAARGDSEGLLRRDRRTPPGDNARRIAAPTHVSESRHGAPELLAGTESFPSPPAPLTAQERLLREIALTGSKAAFELLNEETREAALAASDAEFEAFVRSARSVGRTEARKLEDLNLEQ